MLASSCVVDIKIGCWLFVLSLQSKIYVFPFNKLKSPPKNPSIKYLLPKEDLTVNVWVPTWGIPPVNTSPTV